MKKLKLQLYLFSIFSILTGFLCGILGSVVINPNDLYIDDEVPYFDGKCYPLLIDSFTGGMLDYALRENDAKGYAKWLVRIARKISKDLDDYMGSKAEDQIAKGIDECKRKDDYESYLCIKELEKEIDDLFYYANPKYNDSLCKDVGIPSFVFAIFVLIGLILFAISSCCIENGGDENNSLSQNEEL